MCLLTTRPCLRRLLSAPTTNPLWRLSGWTNGSRGFVPNLTALLPPLGSPVAMATNPAAPSPNRRPWGLRQLGRFIRCPMYALTPLCMLLLLASTYLI